MGNINLFGSIVDSFFAEDMERREALLNQDPSLPLNEVFAGLDLDVWALLLLQQLDGYPAVARALPSLPPATMQRHFVSVEGYPLILQSLEFVRRVYEQQARYGQRSFDELTLLDFGCGWGRNTRFFCRDLPPERIFGCDPSQEAIDACHEYGVPGRFFISDADGGRLPFEQRFDLIFAYSVFTHFGEDLHRCYLPLLAEHMTEGALLMVTVRPRHQLVTGPNLPTTSDPELQARLLQRYDNGEFVFQTYTGQKSPTSWGEAFIPRSYIEEQWSRWFDIVDYQLLLHTMAQFVVVLQKK